MRAWRFFLEHRAEIIGVPTNTRLWLIFDCLAFAIVIAVP